MNFSSIKQKIEKLNQGLKELESNPTSGLLRDKLKSELIAIYDMLGEAVAIEKKVDKALEAKAVVVEMQESYVDLMELEHEEFIEEVEEEVIEEEVFVKPVMEIKEDNSFDLFSEILYGNQRGVGKEESKQEQKEEPKLEEMASFKLNKPLFPKEEKEKIEDIFIEEEIVEELTEEKVELFEELKAQEIESTFIKEEEVELHEEIKAEEEIQVVAEEVSYVEKVRTPQIDKLEQYRNMPIDSLATTIPIGKKFEFIEDLFIGNSDEYSKAIKQIDSMPDFKNAEEFLMINYFDKFGWMEKEKVLNNLFDFVNRRFAA